MKDKLAVHILAAGRMGGALGLALHRAGVDVTLWCRSPHRAHLLSQAGLNAHTGPLPHPLEPIIILSASDESLGPLAEQLAPHLARPQVALHLSGSLGPDVLAPLKVDGGVLHPLQTVSDPIEGAPHLMGAPFGVAGHPEAVAAARRLAQSLGGTPFDLPQDRTLYHAAAVMASNLLLSLLDLAQSLLTASGPGLDPALLFPLIRTTLDNALRQGPAQALTGPVSRGEGAVVQRHLKDISHRAPQALEVYRALSIHALDLARRQGLAPERAAALEALLRR